MNLIEVWSDLKLKLINTWGVNVELKAKSIKLLGFINSNFNWNIIQRTIFV
jgi:hypothetical protein